MWCILDPHELTEQMNRATYKGDHTPDLVISRDWSSIIVGIPSVCDFCVSGNKGKLFGDHLIVQFIINMIK